MTLQILPVHPVEVHAPGNPQLGVSALRAESRTAVWVQVAALALLSTPLADVRVAVGLEVQAFISPPVGLVHAVTRPRLVNLLLLPAARVRPIWVPF